MTNFPVSVWEINFWMCGSLTNVLVVKRKCHTKFKELKINLIIQH